MLPLPYPLFDRRQRRPTSNWNQHGDLLCGRDLCAFAIFNRTRLWLYSPIQQIQGVGLEPNDASLALGGLGLTGLVSCIIGCFVFMERRELVISTLLAYT